MQKSILSFITFLAAATIACGQNTTPAVSDSNISSLWLSLTPAGPKVSLCEQIRTSAETMSALVSLNSADEVSLEDRLPAKVIFLFTEDGIENDETARLARLSHNYAAIGHSVIHKLEIYERLISENPSESEMRDVIEVCRLEIEDSLIDEVLQDQRARVQARALLKAWSEFDGNLEDDSEFFKAFAAYNDCFNKLPLLISAEDMEAFKAIFWDWYDKKVYLDQIDDFVKLRHADKDAELSEDALAHAREVIESEPDVNRRAILALELFRVDATAAIPYLGEIIECGQYTKYLLECWLAWRASVQCNVFSPSSYGLIANNYYDMLRSVCVNTMLRHYQESHDKCDLCMITNLSLCQNMRRMHNVFGNESLSAIVSMKNGKFDHPRATGED